MFVMLYAIREFFTHYSRKRQLILNDDVCVLATTVEYTLQSYMCWHTSIGCNTSATRIEVLLLSTSLTFVSTYCTVPLLTISMLWCALGLPIMVNHRLLWLFAA